MNILLSLPARPFCRLYFRDSEPRSINLTSDFHPREVSRWIASSSWIVLGNQTGERLFKACIILHIFFSPIMLQSWRMAKFQTITETDGLKHSACVDSQIPITFSHKLSHSNQENWVVPFTIYPHHSKRGLRPGEMPQRENILQKVYVLRALGHIYGPLHSCRQVEFLFPGSLSTQTGNAMPGKGSCRLGREIQRSWTVLPWQSMGFGFLFRHRRLEKNTCWTCFICICIFLILH